MISYESTSSFSKAERYLQNLSRIDIETALNRAGQEGVNALSAATPIDTSETANSWNYSVKKSRDSAQVIWTNSHVAGGAPVVIMLQYGHGTGTGGYVQGRDFINPAMEPIFEKIKRDVFRAVRSA